MNQLAKTVDLLIEQGGHAVETLADLGEFAGAFVVGGRPALDVVQALAHAPDLDGLLQREDETTAHRHENGEGQAGESNHRGGHGLLHVPEGAVILEDDGRTRSHGGRVDGQGGVDIVPPRAAVDSQDARASVLDVECLPTAARQRG